MWQPMRITIAIGLIAGLVVACAPAAFLPGTVEAPRTVTITALDSMDFDPARIEVRAGETIRFVVTNTGVLAHEFAIGSRAELLEHAQVMVHGGMREDTPTAIRLNPGQTKELIYTFGSSTDIGYGCMVPDHFPAGMSGSFDIIQ